MIATLLTGRCEAGGMKYINEVSMFELIDLSVPIEHNMNKYPTDPTVEIMEYKSYDKNRCKLSRLLLSTHTGTHVDAPAHHFRDRKTICDYPLNKFCGRAVVIYTPKKELQPITPEDFDGIKITKDDIVLINTDWDVKRGSDIFYTKAPFFSEKAAEFLCSLKIKAVGSEMHSIDRYGHSEAPAHKTFLQNDVVIYEGLVNLGKIKGKNVVFIGFPLPIKEGDGAPVRAVAMLLE